jgi:secondary thiamine-phosphate synthase enzyme
MPQSSITQSINYTISFLLLLFICFFPGLPQYLLKLPLRPFLSSRSKPTIEPITCPRGCVPTQHLTSPDMAWFQKTFTLPPQSRGSFLITDQVVKQLPEINDYKVGLLHLFIQHTSCALSLNENWDSDVREDMSDALDRLAPEDKKGNLYRHSAEGLDDMPVGDLFLQLLNSLTGPIGTYQVVVNGYECQCTHHKRKARDRDLARDPVSRVPPE